MDDLELIEKYIDLAVRALPLVSILFLTLKPIRNAIGRWLAEALTKQVREDMNNGFSTINETLTKTKIALNKSENLQTRRHRSNQREIKAGREETKQIGEEMKKRMDDHLIDHGKDTDVPRDIP